MGAPTATQSAPVTPEQLATLAVEAGQAILAVYQGADAAVVERKGDDSPLTEADRRSHAVIVAGLAALSPHVPVVSEEDDGGDPATRLTSDFWLVDPLDGTKEFLKRTGEFTVNIALVRGGVPVAGVVHAPVLGVTWITTAGGAERWEAGRRQPIGVAVPAPVGALRVVASRDHAGPAVRALLDRLPGATTLSMGSSLKFCLVAEGRADLYFRDGPTMPWDTAAAHAVLLAAGGDVLAPGGEPLRYHAPRRLNPQFVALGDQQLPWASLISTGDAI
jgi:3'(2'), 5'-bisphosphate nucleotidase